MFLDDVNKRDRIFFSRSVYLVDKDLANYFIRKGSAKLYNLDTVKLIVILDGKKIIWSEYLKYRRNEKKNQK